MVNASSDGITVRGSGPLLNDMSEFVRQQSTPFVRFRREPAIAENDVAPNGVGECVHIVGRLAGEGVGMDAHSLEIVSEALLHVLA